MFKVYGDLMLDRWITGSTTRISPEAPVPILLEDHQTFSLGGAGNLAINLFSLDNQVSLFGAIASDKEGYKIIELIGNTYLQAEIDHDATVTTTKTRLVGSNGQHIMRWDREERYKGNVRDRLIQSLSKEDTVLISDYNKGTVDCNLIKEIVSITKNVFVDPKQEPEIYRNVFLIKPNMKEYEQWFGKFDIEIAKQKLLEFNWNWLIITAGSNGLYVINKLGESWHYKEEAIEVADVTGAGDTVLAVVAHLYQQGIDIPGACRKACYASARTVEQRGVVAVTKDYLNTGIVFTNGCFDIIHVGHIELLKFAKSKGRRLVVGINSDESIHRLKGPNRPKLNQQERKEFIESLNIADEVIIFDEDTPYKLIKELEPDVIVKGGDYNSEEVVGRDIAQVIIFPYRENYSTTNILKRYQA